MKKVVVIMMGVLFLFAVVQVNAQCTFSDVPESHIFYDYITGMCELGITTGYSDGTFRPGNNVTRGQMSAFIMRTIDNLKPASPVPNFEGEVCWIMELLKGDPGTPQGLIKMNIRYLADSAYLVEGGALGSYITGTARIFGSTVVGTLNQSAVDPESTHVGIAHVSLDTGTLNGSIEMISHNYEQTDPTTIVDHNYSKWSMTLVSCEECSPGCPWEWLSDDYCDAACNVPACNYDGGDCEECSPGCPIVWLGDGICDAACNVAACNFDNGDCQ
jgi:hypothetical protein